jgi:hypothetical protein
MGNIKVKPSAKMQSTLKPEAKKGFEVDESIWDGMKNGEEKFMELNKLSLTPYDRIGITKDGERYFKLVMGLQSFVEDKKHSK